MKMRLEVILTLASLLTCLLWACSGNEPGDMSMNIGGKWKWISSDGGFAGDTVYSKNQPDLFMLKFENGKFFIYKDGLLIQKGTYKQSTIREDDFGDSCDVLTTATDFRHPSFYACFTILKSA